MLNTSFYNKRWCLELYKFWNLVLILLFAGMGVTFNTSGAKLYHVNVIYAQFFLGFGFICCAVLQVFCFYQNKWACLLLIAPHTIIIFFLLWAAESSFVDGHLLNTFFLCMWAVLQAIGCIFALARTNCNRQKDSSCTSKYSRK